MTVDSWSEHILVGELQDDPLFTDDLVALLDEVEEKADVDVVLNLANVSYLNSSNIAKLLKLRKKVTANRHRLILAGIDTTVWGIFLVTGLDKVFEFAESIATGLAAAQIGTE